MSMGKSQEKNQDDGGYPHDLGHHMGFIYRKHLKVMWFWGTTLHRRDPPIRLPRLTHAMEKPMNDTRPSKLTVCC